MSRLHFRDINDWTPASISIVDKPYHPLDSFEVYENDKKKKKKFIDPEDEKMTKQNPAPSAGDNVTVSGSFLERLLERVVAKNEPTPSEGGDEGSDEVSKKILEKLDAIEENQAKTDERLAALENPASEGEGEGEQSESGEEGGEGEGSTPEQVELPLNEDGTLDLENEVVAKYLPRGFTPSSQGIDPDGQQNNKADKSFNARTGRDANGMNW